VLPDNLFLTDIESPRSKCYAKSHDCGLYSWLAASRAATCSAVSSAPGSRPRSRSTVRRAHASSVSRDRCGRPELTRPCAWSEIHDAIVRFSIIPDATQMAMSVTATVPLQLHCTTKEQVAMSSSSSRGLTSHSTHYRSFRGRFLQVIRANQQCQSTEGNQLVFQIRLESHQDHSTMLQ